MRGLLALLLPAALIGAAPARGQSVVTSAGPAAVSVTVYRAPNRGADEAIDRDAPQGFALITETRTITIPAGRATIRFEGVAGNIFPESAIVSGLPGSVREKNLDAALLSPRSLYDRALGRRVMLRRTDKATGKVSEEQAVIRSSATGAAIIQTGSGFEALRCSGMPETLVYDDVPAGLSAKPSLSVETDSAQAVRVTITLSYLAGGFDWQADYVVRLAADGRHADLFAWVTLASSDVTSFANAATQVVAGKLNRELQPEFGNYGESVLSLKCWPDPDYGARDLAFGGAPPPLPPPAPAMMMEARAMNIVVTGVAVRKAVQEELGDLKLYRITDRVTVASKAQKQVAMLSQPSVPLATVYVTEISGDHADGPVLTLRGKNRKEAGLGLPLPAGQVAVFDDAGQRPILIGESSTDDKAVGEDVEFKLDATPTVRAELTPVARTRLATQYRLVVTNAHPWPIAYEAKIAPDAAVISAVSSRLGKRDGKLIWATTVPANGTATLAYSRTTPR